MEIEIPSVPTIKEKNPRSIMPPSIFLPRTMTSFTCKLSLINGTAFITNPSRDLVPYVGYKITLNDGTQNLVGWIKTAGTGETLGSELITGWTQNGGYSTFTTDVKDITSAIRLLDGLSHSLQEMIAEVGTLLKLSTIIAHTGQCPSLWFMDLWGYDNRTQIDDLESGANTRYICPLYASGYINFVTGLITNYSATDNSLKRVTGPSATGVTIVSTKGGATYNWTSDGGVNPNSASWTATITVS